MQYLPRQHFVTSLGFLLCLLLTSCEGSPWGTSLEKNLEPDPRLLEEETANDETTLAPNGPPSDAPVADAEEAEADQTSETTDAEEPVAAPPAFKPSYTDIGEAPEELQQYIEDLVNLNVLMLIDVKADDNVERDPNDFLPNQIITRREYARWLLAVNNRFYGDQRTKKIRPAVNSSQPVFQDVGTANIDFAAIQGLAEAGIIPSPLNGSSTAVTFRPNAPLTRKDLILWKVPLDTRAALPAATATAVTEAWGFQDAGKIEPAALKAVLADHNNGEFANIRRALGYTTLFQPDKGVTRAEAAVVLWRFGNATEGISAADLLEAEEGGTQNSEDTKTDESQEGVE
ncbi:S-layer homology domain-containing protein [Leptolyngbya cf. ectocarpi LEGE 11479]|uniref:S-layer homology domain-containing protein n=1 Tax=Leptolyngbya cf. ectocarpi LEGE 11479 TaxID=1828722 RepID=A0A928ZVA8_LEPEC|nr:S-layer homology domain-containing protein [Leptolyngbya ectocarpi]MBE9068101.1 S-layer homology domain-containing protein [Leptolyngbya cf. ectocarpi LEGE 11479]